ncbi:MAG TPA: hypothetical protein VGH23_15850 [Rhizomicrobium sp.]|jgi:hypothetical protein
MKLRAFSVLGYLALAACSSLAPKEFVRGEPTRIVLTSYTPEQARDCVVALDPARYIPAPIPGGWKVTDTQAGLDGQALFVVTITPTLHGSRVAYWERPPAVVGSTSNYAEPCLDRLPPA